MLNSNNERELCYLVKVDAIHELPGYDRVESAEIGGWRCIVPKGQFAPGTIGIYFEIDSLVPDTNPVFDFMSKRHYKVKTQKMCKSISQGLLMHPSDFGWYTIIVDDNDEMNHVMDPEGNKYFLKDDSRFLTKVLGVKYAEAADEKRKAKADPNAKYKAMMSRHPKLARSKFGRWCMKHDWAKKLLYVFLGKKKVDNAKAFPTHFPHVHKSDEERVENMPWILEDESRWIKTTKIDGTSCTYILERKPFNKREFYVCSRNVRQLDRNQETYHDDNVYWEIEDKYHIRDFLENMLTRHPDWNYVALQGEGAGRTSSGGKIQGDPHRFGELRFFAYNFIDPIQGRWNSADAKILCAGHDIEWVPIVDDSCYFVMYKDFEDFKLSADGECEAPGAHGMREGYVYRNYYDNRSFKNVSREYLLKH